MSKKKLHTKFYSVKFEAYLKTAFEYWKTIK